MHQSAERKESGGGDSRAVQVGPQDQYRHRHPGAHIGPRQPLQPQRQRQQDHKQRVGEALGSGGRIRLAHEERHREPDRRASHRHSAAQHQPGEQHESGSDQKGREHAHRGGSERVPHGVERHVGQPLLIDPTRTRRCRGQVVHRREAVAVHDQPPRHQVEEAVRGQHTGSECQHRGKHECTERQRERPGRAAAVNGCISGVQRVGADRLGPYARGAVAGRHVGLIVRFCTGLELDVGTVEEPGKPGPGSPLRVCRATPVFPMI